MTTSLSLRRNEKENIPPMNQDTELNNQAAVISATGNTKPITVYQPKHPKPQLKSILKFRPPIQNTSSTTSANVAPEPTTIQEMISEAEPLQCSDYLQGPLEILRNSLHQHSDNVIMHDITEAYSLLSARLRAEAERLSNGGDFPALTIWTNHRNQFIDAVTRDIRLASRAPLTGSLLADNLDLPPASSSASTSKKGINEDEIMYLRDASRLCQSALLLLSDIFRFQTLQLIFTQNQLSVMLNLILEVVSAEFIPTPSAPKIYGLAIWILQSQNLPLDVLALERRRIASAFQIAISGTSDVEKRKKSIFDGLKGINDQLSRNPDIFLPVFTPIIPNILSYLVSTDVNLRLQSGLTLGSFASALLHSTASFEYHKSASNMVGDFVDYFRRSLSSRSLLSQMFQLCLANNNPITPAEGPLWAISVISALIILSGPNLFSRPRSLKLAVFALAEVKRHRRKAVRSLQPAAWKCLVWAFAQLPKWSNSADGTNMGQSIFEQIYRVLKQELSGDIAVALVGSLLGSLDPYWAKMGISKSLQVIKELIAKGSEGAELGAAILQRLLQDVGKQYINARWNDMKIISAPLLDGTIAGTQWTSLGDGFLCLNPLSASDIRAFNEEELNREWDMLFNVWEDCVKVYTANESDSLPAVLLDIWQSLLLVQAQLSQGNGHLTVQPLISTKISTLLLSFLVPDTCSSDSLHLRGLIITRQLWIVTRNVFSSAWLLQMAEVLLTTVLGRRVNLNNKLLESAWKGICVDLLNYSSPDVVRIIFEASPEKQDVELRKQLWIILAKGYITKSNNKPDIEELISILINPLEHWILNESMLTMWISVLQITLRCSDESTDLSLRAIDAITEKLLTSVTDCSCINALNALNAIFTSISSQKLAKYSNLLVLTNHVLTQSYLSNTLPLNPAFNLFTNLRTLLHRNVVSWSHFTDSVEKGLVFWVEDRSKRLTDSQYNEHVIPLYCDILKEMDAEAIEIGTFYKYSDFFSSAFDRPDIPWPASGPLAFKALWEKISLRNAVNHIVCPNKLWSCITGLYDAYGGVLPDWLIVDPQSSSQSSSVPSPAKLLSRVMQESAKINSADKDKHHQDGYILFQEQKQCQNLNSAKVTSNEESVVAGNLESNPDSDWARSKDAQTPEFIRVQKSQRIPQEVNLSAEPSSDDHDLWEVSLKTPDIRILKHGLEDSNSQELDTVNESVDVASPSTRAVRRRRPPTPESKQSHKRRKHDDRSQSAPMIRTRNPQSPTSLRRIKTTTSAPLDVLENLRVSVVNNAQDMGTQDLAQSAKYVYEIAGILNEEISRKLVSKKKVDDI